MNLRKEEKPGRSRGIKGEDYENDIPTSANQLITNPFSSKKGKKKWKFPNENFLFEKKKWNYVKKHTYGK